MEEHRLSFWPQGILLPNAVCAAKRCSYCPFERQKFSHARRNIVNIRFLERHRGIRGTRYLFAPLRRITLHAPDTSQRVERFQHDSSGWINLDSTQQLKLL